MRSLALVALASCVGASTCLAGATAPPSFADTDDMRDLPARWRPLMEEFQVPGMAIAVVKDGRLHAVEGFGSRDGDPTHAVTPDTIFYIASITKTFNAFAICMLADQGRLSLDDPVRKHLPRFTLADAEATERITLRDLLCHRPGLNSSEIVTLDAYTGEITDDRYYHWLALAAPAGEMAYSNLHFTLLGRVIEAAGVQAGPGGQVAPTTSTWRDTLQAQLFTPAGMTRTTGYASRMYGDPDSAVPLERQPDGSWRPCAQIKSDDVMHAAGGLGTSAADGARWILLNVNDGEIDGRRLLSAERAKEMRTLQASLAKPQGSLRILKGFGLGWQVGTYAGRPLCSHGGGYVGTSAYVALLPDLRSGLFILMNAGGPAQGLGDIIAIDLLNRLTGENLAPDLLENYQRRLKQEMAGREQASPAPIDGTISAAGLAVPIEACVGTFTNPHMGTLHIEAVPGGLRLRVGQCVLRAKGGEGNTFTIIGPVFESTKGVMEVAGDRAVRVRLAPSEGGGELVFER